MMRSRAELKQQAKSYLHQMWLPMVGVGFVLALIGGAFTRSNTTDPYNYQEGITIHFGPWHWHYTNPNFVLSAFVVILALAAIVAAVLIAVYLKNPVEYGCKSWFRHVTDGTQDGRVLSAFNSPDYHRIVVTLFKRDLSIFLWSLCFLIPGFIKHYEYYFVPQLLEDHPELTPDEILALSSEMTMGHKTDLFLFDLSYFGWYLLESITWGLSGILYSYPYKYMTQQLMYLDYQECGMDPYYAPEEDPYVDDFR